MLRRLKKQVAKDLPDRIEERRDCELGDLQRKLYLAELRRSREQVAQIVAEKGLNKSKMHVLAALTRLRQICCHPQLVGNDSVSGKTETLFELLEPLLAQGHKVLIFSQFVQMLKLLESECGTRHGGRENLGTSAAQSSNDLRRARRGRFCAQSDAERSGIPVLGRLNLPREQARPRPRSWTPDAGPCIGRRPQTR